MDYRSKETPSHIESTKFYPQDGAEMAKKSILTNGGSNSFRGHFQRPMQSIEDTIKFEETSLSPRLAYNCDYDDGEEDAANLDNTVYYGSTDEESDPDDDHYRSGLAETLRSNVRLLTQAKIIPKLIKLKFLKNQQNLIKNLIWFSQSS